MATKKKAARRTAAPPLAIKLLMDDHKTVDKLFRQCSRAARASERHAIVQKICAALTVHATIEEEIFYPEVRAALKQQDLLDEALVEHGSIKALVAALKSARPGDELYDGRVTVLKEYVKHHVKEEEEEMFPKVKRAGLDLTELGERLQEAKEKMEG